MVDVPRILTFSSLYPNIAQPQHGIFVEQRLRHLVASDRVSARVVAPVPWYPSALEKFAHYPRYSSVPKQEERYGISIRHPKYIVLPKIGMTVAPGLMAGSLKRMVDEIFHREFKFDLIDAHYFYPDGVAAAWLARKLEVPLVITARGTDINLIPEYRVPRKMILWAARHATAIIAVSRALKDRMIELGIDEEKITVLRNGVDLDLFAPVGKNAARDRIGGWNGTWLLSVGHLIERKGHHLTIEALASLPDLSLAIVGDGPLRAELGELAESLGVADRVHFAGAVSQNELRYYYSAADIFVLASSREGMANVLLESLACGLPVVATPIWGTPEVVSVPAAGALTRDRSAGALSDAVAALLQDYPDRRETRRYAEGFSWDNTTQGQIEIFRRINKT